MKKLIKGIMEFRRTRREEVREMFAQLALGQNPDCFFIACSDSRVAVNVFASTDPGDLFVIRNLGNIVPPAPDKGSAVAALEYALGVLKVSHVIICGHSDCGAIRALDADSENLGDGPLGSWLRHAKEAVGHDHNLDDLSKRNVALQIGNLRSHPMVRQQEAAGKLKLHGIWFNIRSADVLYLENAPQGWVVIDDVEGEKILNRLDS